MKPNRLFKSGVVGVIGPTNAGKSSLVNKLIQTKVSIVTPKAQTTRQRIKSIYSSNDIQILFLDTPGFIEATKNLNGFLAKEWAHSIKASDVLLFMLSTSLSPEETDLSLKIAKKYKSKNIFLLFNKIDVIEKKYLIKNPHIKTLIDSSCFKKENIFFGSVKNNELFSLKSFYDDVSGSIKKHDSSPFGKKKLLCLIDKIKTTLPHNEPLYESEIYTLQTKRQLVEEFIREVCFFELQQEIPYGLAVQVRKWENKKSIVHIHADIVLNKKNYKLIVVGKNGSKIKIIGTKSRKQIENLLQTPIFLKLFVCVRPKWDSNKQIMKELGYQYD